ncbi:hypothetical protein E1176_05115 [Fulvivirga sp. RKSG066]|uniref:hypothetical protein n=1 Tax=Fulvivirga aurantia TaxID=2529383 RepID=UPI0012BD58F3|nr:hypothetical protein [Fulvivirga aurantia]MTI20395.1 hypothetical protein [Fulvivirga aurantia]
MAQLIIPTDNKIDGPWLLDSNALEQLSETLLTIEEKLEEAFEILAVDSAKSSIDEYRRWNEKVTLEQAIAKTKGSYRFSESEKYVEVISKEGKKIKDESIISLLKDPNIKDFKPAQLRIHIRKGPSEFSLEVGSKYDGELETRAKIPEEGIMNDVNYEIGKWIDKHKPSMVLQKWSSWFGTIAFFSVILLLILTGNLIEHKKDLYEEILSNEAAEMLINGISESESQRALEILIQKEFDYVPTDFNPDLEINSTIVDIWLIALIALIILAIKPKTIVGLGKNAWKVKFFVKWIYIVFVFIPLSILLPLLRAKLM